jgi:hypothetical protein
MYRSDWTDGMKPKTLPTILFLYFACLAPAVAFGGISYGLTKGACVGWRNGERKKKAGGDVEACDRSGCVCFIQNRRPLSSCGQATTFDRPNKPTLPKSPTNEPGSMGVIDFLLSCGMSGMIYSVFSGQPMTFIGPTGLTLCFTTALFQVGVLLQYLNRLLICVGLGGVGRASVGCGIAL